MVAGSSVGGGGGGGGGIGVSGLDDKNGTGSTDRVPMQQEPCLSAHCEVVRCHVCGCLRVPRDRAPDGRPMGETSDQFR